MGKVRHRKRTRDARISATAAPLTGLDSSSTSTASTDNALATPGQQANERKGSKREQEITTLLDKLRSEESRERVWAASTLSSLLLTLPPLQHRLLLSRNLIGLLIEKLALPLPSTSDPNPPPPPSDDLTTSIESLGSLRNLAVSSPPHILSEMHNKRVLLPLTSVHLPLLAVYLPSVLGPAPAPLKPSLPATPEERERVELANEANETLRQGYWDWAENVLVLLWSLAESNTKILASLNAHGEAIVQLCMSFLAEERLGLDKVQVEGADGEGMDVEAGDRKKKGKKDAKDKGKKGGRVPLFVAVAAAQTLHAFLSSNPPCHTHLLASHGTGFSPSLHSLLSILLTPSPPSPSASSSGTATEEDWTQLRVLSFGTLLELAKGRSKRRDIQTVREVLRSEEAQSVLLSLVSSASTNSALHSLAEQAKGLAAEIDPTLLPSSHPKADTAEGKLLSLEKQAQTLQLGLEVLSEWLASGVPDSKALAGGDVAEDGDGEEGMMDGEEDEEEWGGISMDMDSEGDLGMDEDDEEDGEGEDDGIIRKTLPGEGDDAMLDDLAATAAAESDSDNGDDEDKPAAIKLLGGSLPLQLLALSQPTPLAFLPPAAFASPLTRADAAPSGLIPSSTNQTSQLPSALSALSEALTTVSVRAVEALNNLYVTLARAKAKRSVKGEVQHVFETMLALMHQALMAADAPAPSAPAAEGKKKGKSGAAGGGSGGEEVVDEVQERRMEVVMAGAGVVWGCVRLGLDQGAEEQLVIGPDTLPFLVSSLYPSTFAAAPTPAGEAIRVRTLGALGWLGRRKGVSAEENKQIGSFLLSLLPPTPSAAASATPSSLSVSGTPDILLQAIDSFIDLYADEERDYDVPVFREGGMLQELEGRVAGVRAAVKKIDRNKFPELRLRADGALENLVAFVGYRKDVVRPKGQGRRR
ncbi:hypothetical protein JCM11251_005279 [Rhodosporidiobolus azoricus]